VLMHNNSLLTFSRNAQDFSIHLLGLELTGSLLIEHFEEVFGETREVNREEQKSNIETTLLCLLDFAPCSFFLIDFMAVAARSALLGIHKHLFSLLLV